MSPGSWISALAIPLVLSFHSDIDDLVVPPVSAKIGPEAALFYGQGASISPQAYLPLAQAIQDVVPFPLWIAVPKCPFDAAAIPTCLKEGIARAKSRMKSMGMTAAEEDFFYGGHSLGGSLMPDYVLENANTTARGLILMGSFLQRKFRTGISEQNGGPIYDFPVPTLTIGAELDGLCRLTRIAEALHTQITMDPAPFSQTARHFPVAVIPGMTHMQFASGEPPFFVKLNDLKPEISSEYAHSLVAAAVAPFMMATRGGRGSEAAWADVELGVEMATSFVSHIVKSLEMEAYNNFLPPCFCESKDEYGYSEYGTCVSNSTCTGGTPWTNFAQKVLVDDIQGLTLQVTDSSHKVTEELPSCHLPHIHGNPDNTANPGNGYSPSLCPSPVGCTLNITTVTQQIYNPLPFDTGFTYVSAFELRAKLKSRQAILHASGVANASYAKEDKPISQGGKQDLCAKINSMALDWALARLPKAAAERYEKRGQKLVVGADMGTCAAGPCWIYDPIRYSEDKDGNVAVQSIFFGSENHNIYPCGEEKLLPCDAGFHYCKLLSPARALEWMLIDSLRGNSSSLTMADIKTGKY